MSSPCCPRDSQESSVPQFESISSSVISPLYGPTFTSIHDYGKTIALTRWTFVRKVISLLFNTLSRFVIVFLPRSKRFLISWLQSSPAVILEPKKVKSLTVSIVSPSICHEVMGLDAIISIFWILSFKLAFPVFQCPLSPSSRGSIVPLYFLPLGWYHLHIWGYWNFSCKSWFQLVLHPAWHFVWCTRHIRISRVTGCSFDILLSQFGTSLSFHL